MASKKEILSVLKTLALVYDKEPGSVEPYYWVLETYSKELIEQAAKMHVQDSKWYPKPSELLDQLRKLKGPHHNPEDMLNFDDPVAVYNETKERKRALQEKWQNLDELYKRTLDDYPHIKARMKG